MPVKIQSKKRSADKVCALSSKMEAPTTEKNILPRPISLFSPLTILTLVLLMVISGMVSIIVFLAPEKIKPAADNRELIQRVGRHIVIDSTEQPTIATIQDINLLKKNNPEFYKHAHAGDKILIWSDKAVIYSEEADILLEVLPLYTLIQASTQPMPTPTAQIPEKQPELAKIEVRNGTFTPRLAAKIAETLKQQGFDVLKPQDSSIKPYEKTQIIQISDQPLTETMNRLSELIKGEISQLPDSEINVKGDILIILGQDYKP